MKLSNRITTSQVWELFACGACLGIIVFFAGYHYAPKTVLSKPAPTLNCKKVQV